MSTMPLFEELEARGLIQETSHPEIKEYLNTKKLSFYIGYDPTAKSLQMGNLLQIILMKRLQLRGHKPYVLVGGATGMIGDPSGKSTERVLQDEKTILENIEAQKKQLMKYLDFSNSPSGAVMVNNNDWIGKFNFIEFLRDVGKRFRLSEMLAKDSVKSRLNSESGISFTEFTYQMIQAYDFYHLASKYDVALQMGGGDQWGNITAGIDYTRKMISKTVYGVVIPLVTDAQGRKFGKSEGGTAIYLDPDMTSPYQMYQFLLNSDDASVIKYLNFYSFMSVEEIKKLEVATKETPHLRLAQKALATEVVKFVHGDEGLKSAEQATKLFFGEKIENLKDKDLMGIFSDVPSIEMPKAELETGIDILDLLSKTPLYASKSEARRSVEQKGAYINNFPLEEITYKVGRNSLASETCLVLRKGKKNYCVVRFI